MYFRVVAFVSVDSLLVATSVPTLDGVESVKKCAFRVEVRRVLSDGVTRFVRPCDVLRP